MRLMAQLRTDDDDDIIYSAQQSMFLIKNTVVH